MPAAGVGDGIAWARMRSYLTEQLAQIESTPDPEVLRSSTV